MCLLKILKCIYDIVEHLDKKRSLQIAFHFNDSVKVVRKYK